MVDPFALLGLPRAFAIAPQVLEKRWRELSRTVHPDRFANASPAERRVAIEKASSINEAHRTVKNPQTRASALLALAGRPIEQDAKAPPDVLMEVMELREALEETHAVSQDERAAAITALQARVQSAVLAEETILSQCFAEGAVPGANEVEKAWESALKLRYYYRFLEEAERLTEE